jgi:sensor histidine kinase YesM
VLSAAAPVSLTRRRSSRRYALELSAVTTAGAMVGALIGVMASLVDLGRLEGPLIAIGAASGMAGAISALIAGREVLPKLTSFSRLTRILVVVLTLVGTAFGAALVGFWLYPAYSLHAGRSVLLVGGMNGLFALVAGSLVYIYEDLTQRLARTQEMLAAERLAQAQARERAMRAELQALQARINPHFFFNALNTAMALVAEDPARAEKLLERFAGLFRYAFRRGSEAQVPLEIEISFIRDFLEIEKARFGDRLECEVEVASDVKAVPIPPLILQPLVENAVLHGRDPESGQGHVRVRAYRAQNGEVVLEVRDRGPGPGRAAESWPAGHALENVAARIRGACQGRLEIVAADDGGGTRARVIVPAREPDRERSTA